MSKLLTALVLCLAGSVPLACQTAMPEAGPTGFGMLGPKRAIVWAEGAATFQLWRLDIGGAFKWAPLAIPAALKSFKAVNDPKEVFPEPEVTVTLQDGVLRLFWVENLGCIEDVAAYVCPFTVNQADSRDGGTSWNLSVSKFNSNPPMTGITQAAMADNLHGWMLLVSDPGASQLPEMLATTSDGGRSWHQVEARNMPIGRNYPQLLMVYSASEAWFASIDFDQDTIPILMSHTVDGGPTWQDDTSFEKTFPWCKNCTTNALSAPNNSFHLGPSCFEVELVVDYPNPTSTTSWTRYCLAPDGQSWRPPVRSPLPELSFAEPGLRHGIELPLFADRTLGFSTAYAERKKTNWKDDGNPRGDETSMELAIYQTTDGGRTWHPAAPSLNAQYQRSSSERMELKQVAASGIRVLLLLHNDTQSKLLYSPDHGSTWSEVSMPQEGASLAPPIRQPSWP